MSPQVGVGIVFQLCLAKNRDNKSPLTLFFLGHACRKASSLSMSLFGRKTKTMMPPVPQKTHARSSPVCAMLLLDQSKWIWILLGICSILLLHCQNCPPQHHSKRRSQSRQSTKFVIGRERKQRTNKIPPKRRRRLSLPMLALLPSAKRAMLQFASPALGICLTHPLTSNVDNAFVGRTAGMQALAAMSLATTLCHGVVCNSVWGSPFISLESARHQLGLVFVFGTQCEKRKTPVQGGHSSAILLGYLMCQFSIQCDCV